LDATTDETPLCPPVESSAKMAKRENKLKKYFMNRLLLSEGFRDVQALIITPKMNMLQDFPLKNGCIKTCLAFGKGEREQGLREIKG